MREEEQALTILATIALLFATCVFIWKLTQGLFNPAILISMVAIAISIYTLKQ